MNEEWAEFLSEIERRRCASYEVATDLSDEGKDAERAFGKVDGYDEVLRLISSLGAVFPGEPARQRKSRAWHADWAEVDRDSSGNAILRHKPTGGRYKILPVEEC